MTKSELIEIISAKQKHLPAKDVELAVKQLLEIMSDALAPVNASRSAGSAASRCIFVRRGRGAIPKPAKPWRWPASMCRISSRARTCASASTTARISRSAIEREALKQSAAALRSSCRIFRC
jgi:hypothetical protein